MTLSPQDFFRPGTLIRHPRSPHWYRVHDHYDYVGLGGARFTGFQYFRAPTIPGCVPTRCPWTHAGKWTVYGEDRLPRFFYIDGAWRPVPPADTRHQFVQLAPCYVIGLPMSDGLTGISDIQGPSTAADSGVPDPPQPTPADSDPRTRLISIRDGLNEALRHYDAARALEAANEPANARVAMTRAAEALWSVHSGQSPDLWTIQIAPPSSCARSVENQILPRPQPQIIIDDPEPP
jgi:hypothetical protein